jgi:HlyD family secretion protein
MKKKLIYGTIAVIVIVIVVMVLKPKKTEASTITLNTGKVTRGNINDIITATGTLEALETVEVGTQVSGVVDNIFVDFNSIVHKGQLLAKIDETPLVATLEQSQASVDNAQAELDYQEANYNRTKVLYDKQLIAETEYDLANYNYKKALATLKNAKYVYDRNKINLGYASITSPIDGIILDRAVEEGQTVAASFNTPTLFTIVNDLTHMQVEANIDEADIGKVREGQRVEFTVDAFPDRTFGGTVTQIRLQPVETSNVITYTVIINAPNPDKQLMPGMTANVSFYVTEKINIVVVPAKAVYLNATPDLWALLKENNPELIVEMPEPPKMGKGDGTMPMGKGNMPEMSNNAKKPTLPENMKVVWVKTGNTIKPETVKLGETDEINYEVVKGLNEGDEVVTALQSKNPFAGFPSHGPSSPFMPKPPGRNRKR